MVVIFEVYPFLFWGILVKRKQWYRIQQDVTRSFHRSWT